MCLTFGDAALQSSRTCHCSVVLTGLPAVAERRAVAHADAEGRFSVLAPVESDVPLTASDNGFAPVTQMVSGSGAGLIVFRLPHPGSAGQAENYERFPRGCRCPTDLITRPD